MDLSTLSAWLVLGDFNNDTLQVPSINSTNSTSYDGTPFNVGEQSKPARMCDLACGQQCLTRVAWPAMCDQGYGATRQPSVQQGRLLLSSNCVLLERSACPHGCSFLLNNVSKYWHDLHSIFAEAGCVSAL
jgi:hypothetical protein